MHAFREEEQKLLRTSAQLNNNNMNLARNEEESSRIKIGMNVFGCTFYRLLLTKIVAEAGFAHLATCASVCAHQETRNKDETRWPIFDNTSTVGCKKEEQVSNRNSLRRLYSESVLWLMARYVHNIIGCPGWSLLPHKHKSNSKFSKDGGIGQRLLFFLILLRSCFCSWLVL